MSVQTNIGSDADNDLENQGALKGWKASPTVKQTGSRKGPNFAELPADIIVALLKKVLILISRTSHLSPLTQLTSPSFSCLSQTPSESGSFEAYANLYGIIFACPMRWQLV
jgi:hypothetical protein